MLGKIAELFSYREGEDSKERRMTDPYWRYGVPAVRAASIPTSSFPGYLPSAAPTLSTHHPWASGDLHGSSSDFMQKDISSFRTGTYGVDDIMGVGVRSDPALGGYMTGTSMKGYSTPIEDANLLGPRRDVTLGISPSVPDILNERPSSFGMVDGLPAVNKESNVLFVDGLPNDCSRREVGHLFRPFIGFREIRVVHKEPRRTGDKAKVLCFVEFTDAKCALTALEALQGYKFDNKKPDSPVLRIIFAHFPFRPPSDHEELPFGVTR